MRIVNRKEFLALPSGTVYCKYHSLANEGDLSIKFKSYTNDWTYQIIGDFDDANNSEELFDKYRKMEKDPALSFPWIGDTCQRDGLYEDEQMFIVYSDDDVLNMIRVLTNTIEG